MGYNYLIYKAIHVIFVVSYFAGLFYVVRLMIYHTDTQTMEEPKKSILAEQYKFMKSRLWNVITVPAFCIMVIMGINMLVKNPSLINVGWMQFKLGVIVLLFAYHFWCWKTIKEQKKDIHKYTSVRLRMMNEIATIILFAVVFAVIQKGGFVQHWPWAIISFLLVGVIIMVIVKIINRNNKN